VSSASAPIPAIPLFLRVFLGSLAIAPPGAAVRVFAFAFGADGITTEAPLNGDLRGGWLLCQTEPGRRSREAGSR
jgi:hypothetical protein